MAWSCTSARMALCGLELHQHEDGTVWPGAAPAQGWHWGLKLHQREDGAGAWSCTSTRMTLCGLELHHHKDGAVIWSCTSARTALRPGAAPAHINSAGLLVMGILSH